MSGETVSCEPEDVSPFFPARNGEKSDSFPDEFVRLFNSGVNPGRDLARPNTGVSFLIVGGVTEVLSLSFIVGSPSGRERGVPPLAFRT